MESTKVTRFSAEMTCEGCSNAITRILNRIEGVSNVSCSVPD